MRDKMRILFVSIILVLSGCDFIHPTTRKNGPLGYEFELFDKTPVEKLAAAVKSEDVAQIRKLVLNDHLNVNFRDKKFGNSLLMLAAMHNLNKSIETLLMCGADPNLKNSVNDESAFLFACSTNSYKCNVESVKAMIRHGADVNTLQQKDTIISGQENHIRSTPLIIATESGCSEIVHLLVQHGARIDQYVFYDGYGAITTALIFDELEIARFLIIDCKAPIPEYCFIREKTPVDDEQRLTVTDMLLGEQYEKGSANEKYKKEILSYLKENGLK